ncbi:MAG TPA: PilZ domain-containing protein [Polyangia bacterium]|nr:PilZ domain-containing protein [Polyangia bacterium]
MRDFAWRSGRADVELPVEVSTEQGAYRAACKNIGAGGVFVATDQLPEVPLPQIGTRLAIKLQLPALDRPISLGAEVRWTRSGEPTATDPRSPGMGLRFVDLPVGALIAIHELLLAHE